MSITRTATAAPPAEVAVAAAGRSQPAVPGFDAALQVAAKEQSTAKDRPIAKDRPAAAAPGAKPRRLDAPAEVPQPPGILPPAPSLAVLPVPPGPAGVAPSPSATEGSTGPATSNPVTPGLAPGLVAAGSVASSPATPNSATSSPATPNPAIPGLAPGPVAAGPVAAGPVASSPATPKLVTPVVATAAKTPAPGVQGPRADATAATAASLAMPPSELRRVLGTANATAPAARASGQAAASPTPSPPSPGIDLVSADQPVGHSRAAGPATVPDPTTAAPGKDATALPAMPLAGRVAASAGSAVDAANAPVSGASPVASVQATELQVDAVGMMPTVAATPPVSHAPAVTAGGDAASVAAQIAPAVTAMLQGRGAGRRLSISITPDELGRVSITVERAADGTTTVQVAAERLATLDLLRKDHAELTQALDQVSMGQATGGPGSHTLSFSWDTGAGSANGGASSGLGSSSSGTMAGWSGSGGQSNSQPGGQPNGQATHARSYAEEPSFVRTAAAARGGIDVTA